MTQAQDVLPVDQKTEAKQSPRTPSRTFFLFAGIILVVLGLLGATSAFVWMVFVKRSDRPVVRSVARMLSIPAAKVGSKRVSYEEFLHTRDTLKTFLASSAAKAQEINVPMDENLEKNILEKLLSQAALEELAEKKKVTLTDAELREAFTQVVAAASSTTPDVSVYLLENFGWNEEDFRQQVLKPSLLEQKLGTQMAEESQGNVQALAEYMDARLKDKDVVRYLRFK